MGENPCGHTVPFSVASPKQEKMSRWVHMGNELSDTFKVIGRHQVLLCKNVLKLSVILFGKFHIMGFLYVNAFSFCFANTTAAGARHSSKQFLFIPSQIHFKSVTESILSIKAFKIFDG